MHRIEAYVKLAIIFIAIISILYLPILFVLKKKGKSIIRQISYVGLFISVFLIVFATILFMPLDFLPDKPILNIVPFNWIGNLNDGWKFLVEKIPNIMLFIPLGLFIPIVFKNKRSIYKTILIVFTITFSVEFIQFFIGRSSDIDDIIMNVLGGIIGYSLFKLFDKIHLKKKWWHDLLDNK